MHGIEILLALSLVAFAQGTNSSLFSNWQSSWIVGGKEAAPGEFPYMALVVLKTECCGGVIIDRLHILTAAHCVADLHRSSVLVVVGTNIFARDTPKLEVDRVIIHPDYTPRFNDLALLKLKAPVPYSRRVQRIPLIKQGEETATACVTTGWGHVPGCGSRPGYLQKVKVNILPHSVIRLYCAYVYENHIWTLSAPGTRTSKGDSGGPLVCGGKLIGILIGGTEKGVCSTDSLSMYTGLSNYISWIKKYALRRSSV